MKELVCIVCPVGCSLVVEESPSDANDSIHISGNRCPRGAVYAQEEVRAPKRVVTATCAISDTHNKHGLYTPKRVPVKTNAACPKEKIPELLHDIYNNKISLPVKAGDTVIANWKNSGINVVVTRSINYSAC